MTKKINLVMQVMDVMQHDFPYFESDDKDEYFYMVKRGDLVKASNHIVKLVREYIETYK